MIRETMEIGVLVEYRKLKNRWLDHAWMPSAVLVGAQAGAPWTVIDATPKATRYYAGPSQLDFFRTDTGRNRDTHGRSEERRVGKARVSTCESGWWRITKKK